MLAPENSTDLAQALGDAAARGRTIALGGNSSKRLMAGPSEPADVAIATTALHRVLEYEPHDLTISVEAGLPWRSLASLLAPNRQMVPLDPPFAESASVGGVVASNGSGPRRRLYGTARDLIIGMRFATLEGKLVQSGGMVVKNVAGLDMAKLMIGSFGTLAAIAVVNFKLVPAPEAERSFLLPFRSLAEAIAARNQVLANPLQPVAIDLLNPAAAGSIVSIFATGLGPISPAQADGTLLGFPRPNNVLPVGVEAQWATGIPFHPGIASFDVTYAGPARIPGRRGKPDQLQDCPISC